MITIKEFADGIGMCKNDTEIVFYNTALKTFRAFEATKADLELFFNIIDCFNRRNNEQETEEKEKLIHR